MRVNGAFIRAAEACRLVRLVGAAAISLSLGGCLVSKQPLVRIEDAAFPIAAGTRLEPAGSGRPPVTLQIADGYYEMVAPDLKETKRFRLRPVRGGVFLVMGHFPKDKFPYGYSLARIRNDDVEVFQVSKQNLKGYLTRLAVTDPGRVQAISSQARFLGDFFEVNSLAFVETLLPDMLRGRPCVARAPNTRSRTKSG